jgi:PKD repeat protein
MKSLSVFLVILLLTSTIQGVFAVQNSGIVTDSDRISEAPLNPAFIEFKNNGQPVQRIKEINFKEQLGYIPEPTDSSHTNGKKVSKKALKAEMQGLSYIPAVDIGEIASATATYDLRITGRLSPVKNQGSCGSCWAFATYGSLESELLPDQLYDFSENNLKNTHGFDYGACSGGNSQMATAYLARWSGAVAEADDPYVGSSTTSLTDLPVQAHAQEILDIPGRSGSLDNDNIKAALQTTGALYTTIYWSDTYYNTSSNAYYYSGTSGSNHAVTIVGWDDTYSKNNFNPAAPGDGAFIIKNSWGTSFGNNGYFYLSYYDSQVGNILTAFTGESSTNYNHIYQYDSLGRTSSMGYNSDTAWAANVFTATNSEAIAAVGLFTNQVNTTYQIYIYTNPDEGPVSGGSPVSTVQGIIGIPGYHTVTLPTPVSVNAGQKFSVVVRFQTPNYVWPIAIEKPLSGYSSQATASSGQSYVSSTGSTWTDLTSVISNANSCLKVYTVNAGITAPVANFTASPTSGVSPLTVKFTDISTNSPTSWTWTFGDGGTSTLQNPSYQYTIAGTYSVTLKATNSAGNNIAGNNTLTRTNYITVNAVAPVANFTASPTSGTNPLTVTFTDTSTNSPTSWAWTFGDGGTSTLKNPSHQYTTAGTYSVTLKATNSAGNNILTRTNYIKVIAVAPVANFTASPTSGTNPLTVTFTDTSTNSPTSWAWTFGDGGTSTLKNPSHKYTRTGTFKVTLKATNAVGNNILTRTNYIKVNAYAPVANFTASPTSGVSPLTVKFTDTSTNSPTSWTWTFGDGGTSRLKSPSHKYTRSGSYTVTLIVRNAQGSNKITKMNYIKV